MSVDSAVKLNGNNSYQTTETVWQAPFGVEAMTFITASFALYASTAQAIAARLRVRFYDANSVQISQSDYSFAIAAGVWTRETVTTAVPAGAKLAQIAFLSGSYWFAEPKVESGKMQTPYLVNSAGQAEMYSAELGALAYQDLVELAKLGETIIQGGLVKTELLTASNVITGTLRSADGSAYFDLDKPELVQTATINGKEVTVTFSPLKPIELIIDGIKEIYVSDAGVLVTSRYDVNEDGIVDYEDYQITRDYINTGVGYLPRMDVNGDGNVNVLDLTLIARNSVKTGALYFYSGTCTLNSTTWTTVDFGSLIDPAPTILLTPVTTTSGVIAPKVSNITTSGFDAKIGGSGFSNIVCNWFAFERRE